MDPLGQYITVAELFREASERLHITWLAGKAGGSKRLESDVGQRAGQPLIGHLNLVHPNRIQLLGAAEMDYLRRLLPEGLRPAIESLFANEPVAIVAGGGEQLPDILVQTAERTATPLFASLEHSQTLLRVLGHLAGQALAPSTMLHGVFLEVFGMGVLITGDPAVGKSELALELITRGHRLVADDAVDIYATSPDTVQGRCPALLQDFMEVRGLGVINIRRLFGETAVKFRKNLKFIINLTPAANWEEVDRLDMLAETRVILGVEVPAVHIPVAAGRNLAVLVEVAVRNHILMLRGYNSSHDFKERQRSALKSGEEGSEEAQPGPAGA